MKRIHIYLGLLCFMIAGISLTGCYKDIISPETDPDGPPQAVSFKDELAPLFQAKCATAGCHAAGDHKPVLSADVSYGAIVNGGFVNTLVPKSSRLYIMIHGEMAEYIPSPKDKAKVYDWIRNGAPNN
ncbi:MAG: hypothetical protein ACXWCZ_05510 [Flavisolibacter sp.]